MLIKNLTYTNNRWRYLYKLYKFSCKVKIYAYLMLTKFSLVEVHRRLKGLCFFRGHGK